MYYLIINFWFHQGKQQMTSALYKLYILMYLLAKV